MLSQDSLAVHAGRNGLTELGVHAVPIDLSTTAPLPSVHDGGLAYEHMATGGTHLKGHSTVYQRLWNPTVARFEDGVAVLEGTPESVAFATGMAALSAVLLAVVATDGTVLEEHPLPTGRPSNCAFGGPDLGHLYVTALDGRLYRVPNTGRRGRLQPPAARPFVLPAAG